MTELLPTQADRDAAELLPCPFCGETGEALAVRFSHEAGRWDIWEVECEACCVSKDSPLGHFGGDARLAAITAWNTRASTTPVSSDSVVERVAKAIWLAQADPEWEYIPPLLEQWGALESEFRERAFAQATAALSTLTPAREEGFKAGIEAAAKVAENSGFIDARDTDWDEGFNYAKRYIATRIRALKEAGE